MWGWLLDKVLGLLGRKLDAQTEAQKQAHEERLAVAANARAVRIATSGGWEMRVLTVAIALPFVVHLWAVGIDTIWPQPWDVPKFPPPFDEDGRAILMSFFGLVGVRAIAGAIAKR